MAEQMEQLAQAAGARQEKELTARAMKVVQGMNLRVSGFALGVLSGVWACCVSSCWCGCGREGQGLTHPVGQTPGCQCAWHCVIHPIDKASTPPCCTGNADNGGAGAAGPAGPL